MENLKNSDRWDAGYYKENSNKQFQTGMAVLDKIRFKEDETVLDFGCGDGRLTAEIAKRVPKGTVLGIDISDSMISKAKETYGDSSKPSFVANLSFDRISAVDYHAENKFDRVISFDTFHWIDGQQKALENIYAALKPGGNFYLKMLATNPIDRMFSIKTNLKTKWSGEFRKAYFQERTPEAIKPLLEHCGFVNNIDPYMTADEFRFENQEKLCNWMMAWVPYATGLTEERAREFVHELTQRPKDAPEEIKTKGSSLHVSAHKPR